MICVDTQHKDTNEQLIDSLIAVASQKEPKSAFSIKPDLQALQNQHNVDIPNQIFAILLISKIACASILEEQDNIPVAFDI